MAAAIDPNASTNPHASPRKRRRAASDIHAARGFGEGRVLRGKVPVTRPVKR